MIFLCRSVNMKELLYLGVKLAASCVEAGYEKVKEDWSEKFNIDDDSDLSFLYHLYSLILFYLSLYVHIHL